ncbi:hypothetical protein [Antarctobacter heliothermus]|uniref:Uncharacterized protein n=1 Tax=Antarctobacter heliothermus TaxID=74033 RepID=A0A239ED89_9RHOB|nr:hypothetical protein [Antarctobacter heliothermus]SNS42218.1 hypothetical protein SAMN04488078_101460 [Antarctobacter heliothermus]
MIGPLRRNLIRPPVLAMVDAFVGGTAILLILIILSSNRQNQPGSQPQADVVVRCAEGQVATTLKPDWLPATQPLPPSDAAAWLAAHPRPDRLMTRVRLEADQRAFRCVTRFQQVVGQMNDATDDVTSRDTAQERAILLVTVVMIDPPVAPEP